MLGERSAGILLAVSSLPSPFGIGSFGEAVYEWLDFLKNSGQQYWQILPLGPTGWGDSPYQSFSAFAISPYYVDLQTLVGDELLSAAEVNAVRWGGSKVNYSILYRQREPLLRLACQRFKERNETSAFDLFCSSNDFWLEDYSLFMSLKKKFHNRSWHTWDDKIRKRIGVPLQKAKQKLAPDMYYHAFVQYMAFTQWQKIRDYSRNLGIAIIGDMPIYVASDSADAWANSEYFQLDENQKPLRVAGCPPDYFSPDGQLWGNPLYHWDYIEQTGFAWWIKRLRCSFSLYDILRIDHFRGFESYFSIDANELTAKGGGTSKGGGTARGSGTTKGGVWVKGPGLAFIEAVSREMPGAAIIAEDLGYLTAEVKALLKASGYPGMKVLQFAFDSREASDYMPYTYERNCVVYTGTHDNATSLGWLKAADREDVRRALDYFGIQKEGSHSRESVWAFIRCALASVANTAIIPMQDYLCLDDRARMNTPSTLGGNNWRWRMRHDAANTALAEKIKLLCAVYGRGSVPFANNP